MKKEFNTYYFAYGSNLNLERMKARSVEFTERIPAILKEYKLTFDKKAFGKSGQTYANVQPDKNSVVEGALYLVTNESIEKLDGFEGFPNHYNRFEIDVEVKESSKKLKAWVYIANTNQIIKGKPSKDYLNKILSGKDIFSEDYYQNLLKTQTID